MTPSPIANLNQVGGVLAFNFVNTASGRETAYPFEHLHSASDVVDWAGHAGLIDAPARDRLSAGLADDPASGDRFLRQAITLRETIYRIGAALASGEKPAPLDLRNLKDFARRSLASAELAPTPTGAFAFNFASAPPDTALLGPIAWSAVQLLAAGELARVKQCPGDDCRWLFVDRSKNNSRRWCDMATCGNRSKGKRHRQRH